MFIWTEESIKWQQRALLKTDYYKKIANSIARFVNAEETIYDIGCGLGVIDLELSQFVKQIVAIDVEPRVLDILQKKITSKQISNIETRKLNWEHLEPECCDTLLACSFGFIERDLKRFLALCRKRVIIIRRFSRDGYGSFSSKNNGKFTAENVETYLKTSGVNYRVEKFFLEFGQPFVDLEEAQKFVNHYKLISDDECMEDYLHKHLIKDNDKQYPYFLPNEKEMHVIAIEKK